MLLKNLVLICLATVTRSEYQLEFSHDGQTYKLPPTCTGGVVFRTPIPINHICLKGFFLQRPWGCSPSNETVLSSMEYDCKHTKGDLVHSLIPLTNPEYPTEHTISFYDDEQYMSNMRRYDFLTVTDQGFFGDEWGAEHAIVSNPHNTPGVNIGRVCYQGAQNMKGHAVKFNMSEDSLNETPSGGFFTLPCDPLSHVINAGQGETLATPEVWVEENEVNNLLKRGAHPDDMVNIDFPPDNSTNASSTQATPAAAVITTPKPVALPPKNGSTTTPKPAPVPPKNVSTTPKPVTPPAANASTTPTPKPAPSTSVKPSTPKPAVPVSTSVANASVTPTPSPKPTPTPSTPPAAVLPPPSPPPVSPPPAPVASTPPPAPPQPEIAAREYNLRPPATIPPTFAVEEEDDSLLPIESTTMDLTPSDSSELEPPHHDSAEDEELDSWENLREALQFQEDNLPTNDTLTQDSLNNGMSRIFNANSPYLESYISIVKSQIGHVLSHPLCTEWECSNVLIDRQPSHTKWYALLKEMVAVANSVVGSEFVSPKLLQSAFLLFGYYSRVIEEESDDIDEYSLQQIIEGLQQCANNSKKNWNFEGSSDTDCNVVELDMSTFEEYKWVESNKKYEPEENSVHYKAGEFASHLPPPGARMSTSSWVVAELMWYTVQVSYAHCFKSVTNSNLFMRAFWFLIENVFDHEVVINPWKSRAVGGMDVYEAMMPYVPHSSRITGHDSPNDLDFARILRVYDKISFVIHEGSLLNHWMKRPQLDTIGHSRSKRDVEEDSKKEFEIWGGLAYCLKMDQEVNEKGQVKQIGLTPPLSDIC